MQKIATFSRVFGYLGSAAVMVMMLLTVADVSMRFFLEKPIVGAIELSQILMVLVFLAVPLTTTEESHISVDLVVNRLSNRVKGVVRLAALILTLGICALMAWQAYAASAFSRLMNTTFSLLKVPEYPFYWVVVLGFAGMCVVIAEQIIATLREVVKK